jgi:hypothetical protein
MSVRRRGWARSFRCDGSRPDGSDDRTVVTLMLQEEQHDSPSRMEVEAVGPNCRAVTPNGHRRSAGVGGRSEGDVKGTTLTQGTAVEEG